MKALIAGSRGLSCDDLLEEIMAGFPGVTEVVSGMEPSGVDAAGVRWAKARGIPVTEFAPEWNRFSSRTEGHGGNPAGMARNEDMAVYADFAVVIWDGRSPGSRDMIRRMKAKGKPVYVYTPGTPRLAF